MKKILVVDDQESWRVFHSKVLHAMFGDDIVIDTASSGFDGYNKLMENIKEPYDFMITDMQMETDHLPKMAGEWLIEQAQGLNSNYKTKIIIISASPRINLIAKEYNVDYIRKNDALSSIDAYKDIILSY